MPKPGPTNLRWVAHVAKRKDLHLLIWTFLDPRLSAKSTAILLKIVRFSRLLVTGGRSNLSLPCISCTANMIYILIRPILLIYACCYWIYVLQSTRWLKLTGRGKSFDDLLQHVHGNQITDQVNFTMDCRSYRPHPIYISHMQMIRTYNEAASALIPR